MILTGRGHCRRGRSKLGIMKRACVGGAEYDAFTGWRHVYRWRPGELRDIKRRANKRERRTARLAIGQERKVAGVTGDKA